MQKVGPHGTPAIQQNHTVGAALDSASYGSRVLPEVPVQQQGAEPHGALAAQ